MSGKPTMVEFGATGCIPCDMMKPILDKLRKNYPDRLNVVFVHVRENQILGARFGIQSIPVQVFYDRNGEEVFRHVGFYAEADVLKQLVKLGVE
jgi:thioredoxin 1